MIALPSASYLPLTDGDAPNHDRTAVGQRA
jgi:hypothetical protein